jgi:hypothetical protein
MVWGDHIPLPCAFIVTLMWSPVLKSHCRASPMHHFCSAGGRKGADYETGVESCGLLVWVNFGDGGMAPVQSGIKLFDQPHLSATTFHEGHEWAVLLCKGFLPLSSVGCRRKCSEFPRLEVDVTAHDIMVIIVR